MFEETYITYFPLLYNYALVITKDQAAAEDVVSEIFLKLWEEQHSLVIGKSLKSYLFKSVYNQCLNILKHKKVQRKYEDFFKHLQLLNEGGADYPLSTLLENEITETLQKAIEKLPPQCRKIFDMSRNENMTHEEIAIELGVSVNTVHTQIRRALEKLRIELKDFLPFLLFITKL